MNAEADCSICLVDGSKLPTRWLIGDWLPYSKRL